MLLEATTFCSGEVTVRLVGGGRDDVVTLRVTVAFGGGAGGRLAAVVVSGARFSGRDEGAVLLRFRPPPEVLGFVALVDGGNAGTRAFNAPGLVPIGAVFERDANPDGSPSAGCREDWVGLDFEGARSRDPLPENSSTHGHMLEIVRDG